MGTRADESQNHDRSQGDTEATAERTGVAEPESVDFPVVALGASAGGLDAFKKFFDALPANSGMAYVLIQHLDPTHESLMVDLLSGHTTMKVLQATDQMQLACDRVYLIPPGA
jgi:two-component system CheB/CheR fusion protein